MRFPERYESGRPKVINKTGRKGSEQREKGCYLGELGRPEQVLVTPAQRPKATPIRPNEPEGALADMLPRHRTPRTPRHAVPPLTAPSAALG